MSDPHPDRDPLTISSSRMAKSPLGSNIHVDERLPRSSDGLRAKLSQHDICSPGSPVWEVQTEEVTPEANNDLQQVSGIKRVLSEVDQQVALPVPAYRKRPRYITDRAVPGT